MSEENKFMSSVKVGPKGQVVIPKQVRDMFGIQPGDTLILLADVEKGIAIERMEVFNHIADAILSGKGKELSPDQNREGELTFAKEIKKVCKENKTEK